MRLGRVVVVLSECMAISRTKDKRQIPAAGVYHVKENMEAGAMGERSCQLVMYLGWSQCSKDLFQKVSFEFDRQRQSAVSTCISISSPVSPGIDRLSSVQSTGLVKLQILQPYLKWLYPCCIGSQCNRN